ncbi:hypothetical protein ACHQM5_012829 [Ranunculus cassubicifolius]
MYNIKNAVLASRRLAHTWSRNTPSESLKKEIAKLEMKRKKMRFFKKEEMFFETRESMEYLDTVKMPMVLTFVVVALFAKVLMMV